MIKFTGKNENEQFVSILINDEMSTKKVYEHVKSLYDSINLCFYKMDDEEIVLKLTSDIEYGFSLNELRQTVNKIANATITCFCVDLQVPSQRYMW